MARKKGVRTGPPADPTTILARLTQEERGWFIGILGRLRAAEDELDDHGLQWAARKVRMARVFLDQVLFGHPRPGCAHRENPIPAPKKAEAPKGK